MNNQIPAINKSKPEKQQKCSRCDLNYQADLDCCPHCKGLDAAQLYQLKQQQQQSLQENSQLGRYMAIAAVICAALLILSFQ